MTANYHFFTKCAKPYKVIAVSLVGFTSQSLFSLSYLNSYVFTKISSLHVIFSLTYETSPMEVTATGRPHQATASPGSDALATPNPVGQLSSQQAGPILCKH